MTDLSSLEKIHPNASTPVKLVETDADRLDTYTTENVILRVEYMSDRATKTVVYVFRFVLLLSVVALGLIAYWKFADDNALAKSRKFVTFNASIALICFVVVVGFSCYFAARTVLAARSRKKWNSRRKRLCILSSVDLIFGILYSVG